MNDKLLLERCKKSTKILKSGAIGSMNEKNIRRARNKFIIWGFLFILVLVAMSYLVVPLFNNHLLLLIFIPDFLLIIAGIKADSAYDEWTDQRHKM